MTLSTVESACSCPWNCGRGGHITRIPIPERARPLVLVIDSSKEEERAIREALDNAGIDTVAATGAEETVRLAREVQPNLIVLDADMAKADRYSLCHELQVGPDGWQAPVLLVSKPGELLANVSALECGAIDYLNKPVAPREAIARVRTHLRLQHALEMAGEFQTANLHVLEVAQQACMPRPDDIPGAGFHVALRQAQSAGGDFYDVIDLGHQQFDYLVADASGHDLSSSYWTLALKTLLLEYSTLLFSPADALHLINRALCRILPEGVFFTAIYLRLNRATGSALLLSAGHPPAIFFDAARNKCRLIEQPSDVLGCFRDAQFHRIELKTNPGDRLFFFSDGMVDCWSQQQEGLAHLMEATNRGSDLKEPVDRLHKTFPTLPHSRRAKRQTAMCSRQTRCTSRLVADRCASYPDPRELREFKSPMIRRRTIANRRWITCSVLSRSIFPAKRWQ